MPVNTRPESDEVLVERLLPNRNGDPGERALAWGEWYDTEGRAFVLAFIRAKNDTVEPDMDILQEAMVTAYTQVERGRYKPRAGVPFTAYVKGIAHNKIREARRRTRRFLPLHDSVEDLARSDDVCLEDTVVRQEQRALLRAGLSRLSPPRRRVLQGYLNGHTTAEIAQALGMSEDLVRQHKCRGLRGLRHSLQQRDLCRSYGQ
jgi:RNA polymerase sigma factor (sigma-70 family)